MWKSTAPHNGGWVDRWPNMAQTISEMFNEICQIIYFLRYILSCQCEKRMDLMIYDSQLQLVY